MVALYSSYMVPRPQNTDGWGGNGQACDVDRSRNLDERLAVWTLRAKVNLSTHYGDGAGGSVSIEDRPQAVANNEPGLTFAGRDSSCDELLGFGFSGALGRDEEE